MILENSLPKTKVIDAGFDNAVLIPIELSINSPYFDPSMSVDLFHETIFQYITSANAHGAYGGYLEQRNLYQQSQRFNNQPSNIRNIHLGVDLWMPESTPVLAAYDGVIHSFANNADKGNYGPTIILEHQINHHHFYTLYGHLSVESLLNLSNNMTIKQGDIIGFLGSHQVNGGYPPHLHFQIIKDIQDFKGDYPGVCAQQDIEFYKTNCPNPLWFLDL